MPLCPPRSSGTGALSLHLCHLETTDSQLCWGGDGQKLQGLHLFCCPRRYGWEVKHGGHFLPCPSTVGLCSTLCVRPYSGASVVVQRLAPHQVCTYLPSCWCFSQTRDSGLFSSHYRLFLPLVVGSSGLQACPAPCLGCTVGRKMTQGTGHTLAPHVWLAGSCYCCLLSNLQGVHLGWGKQAYVILSCNWKSPFWLLNMTWVQLHSDFSSANLLLLLSITFQELIHEIPSAERPQCLTLWTPH